MWDKRLTLRAKKKRPGRGGVGHQAAMGGYFSLEQAKGQDENFSKPIDMDLRVVFFVDILCSDNFGRPKNVCVIIN